MTDEAFNHTARELDELSTLVQGQAADLKIDNGDGVRVWLHRTGIDDGEQYENAISVEHLDDGAWVTVGEYDGGDLDPDFDTFTLALQLGSAAMRTPEDVASALANVATRLRDGSTEGRVMDENGNSVGEWELS